MHIGLVGPIGTEYVAGYLPSGGVGLPSGYLGAPLMGVLIGELLARGHRVSAFTTDSSLPLDGGAVTVRERGFTMHYCPSRRRAWRPNGWYVGRAVDLFAFERKNLTEAIRAADVDVIHAHWTYEFALAALDSGKPYVITCHDDPAVVVRLTRSPYRLVRYLMARNVFRRGRSFTAVSSYMADALARYTRSRPTVIPNPVATSAFEFGRARPTPTGHSVAMVSNGWDDMKNPQAGMLGFARFHVRHRDAELHCFGQAFGTNGPAHRWAVKRNLTSGVTFRGPLPHRQLLKELAGVDVLLHPAREESFGVCIAEAMALGLPIVAGARSGAVPWVVGVEALHDQLPAVLVDVNDVGSLSDGLESVFDKDYAARSVAGRKRAWEMFGPPRVTAAYLDYYRVAMGETCLLNQAIGAVRVGQKQ